MRYEMKNVMAALETALKEKDEEKNEREEEQKRKGVSFAMRLSTVCRWSPAGRPPVRVGGAVLRNTLGFRRHHYC